MESFQFGNIEIILNKEGSRRFSKVSYPIRYGRYSEIKTPDYIYQFNMNGEIKYIQGRDKSWPPNEWLKRTITGDWVYYSTGRYSSIHAFIGEYYLPCFSYPSNSIFQINPFVSNEAGDAIRSLGELPEKIKELEYGRIPQHLKEFLSAIVMNDSRVLKEKSDEFHEIIGGTITALPPDARHVDYEIIPVVLADGCLYNCGFCILKTGRYFMARSRENIIEQIENLREFYGRDIYNYNSVFLGNHDALNAGKGLIEFAALNAYRIFEFERSNLQGASIFMFGSVDSMLNAEESLFEILNGFPFYTYINIGLESADQETLDILDKPVTTEAVKDTFNRMVDVNKRYENIEVSANFVFGSRLSGNHLTSIQNLTRDRLDRFYSKGGIYLSSLNDGGTREDMQKKFKNLKSMCRMPVYLYLIQRL